VDVRWGELRSVHPSGASSVAASVGLLRKVSVTRRRRDRVSACRLRSMAIVPPRLLSLHKNATPEAEQRVCFPSSHEQRPAFRATYYRQYF
jgi:hypothetical protein